MLNDNKITGGFKALTIYPQLECIAIENNPIADPKELEPLVLRICYILQKELKKLNELSLASCPLTDKENYWIEIFTLIPQLEVVDSKDKSGKEIEDVIDNDEEDEVIGEEHLQELGENEVSDSEGEEGELDIGKRELPGGEQAENDSSESDSEEEGI